jgi:hypothetical protein
MANLDETSFTVVSIPKKMFCLSKSVYRMQRLGRYVQFLYEKNSTADRIHAGLTANRQPTGANLGWVRNYVANRLRHSTVGSNPRLVTVFLCS